MTELKKTGSDLIPYIGLDRDNDGYVDTIEVKLVRNVVSVDQDGNMVSDYVQEYRGLSTDTSLQVIYRCIPISLRWINAIYFTGMVQVGRCSKWI